MPGRSTRGHVGITQDVGLRLQILQTVLDYITDADDAGELAVAQHRHVSHAMARHRPRRSEVPVRAPLLACRPLSDLGMTDQSQYSSHPGTALVRTCHE